MAFGRRGKTEHVAAALTMAKAGKNASKLQRIVNAFLTLRAVTQA
jgi:hypothetical protein